MSNYSIEELALRYLHGQITKPELNELEDAMRASVQAREKFREVTRIDYLLQETAEQLEGEDEVRSSLLASDKETGFLTDDLERKRQLWRNWRLVALSAVCLVVGLILMDVFSQDGDVIAVIESSENAAWRSVLPTVEGAELKEGSLKLVDGIATLRFRSGVKMTVEAPASVTLVSSMQAKLEYGAAVLDVPEQGIGFQLDTPNGYAVDYGTQFAVSLAQGSEVTEFELLDGEISVCDPTTGKEVRLVGEGEYAQVSGGKLTVMQYTENETEEQATHVPRKKFKRIGYQGRLNTVHKNNIQKYIKDELMSLKTGKQGVYTMYSYFGFSLDELDLKTYDRAEISINMVDNHRGFASRLPIENIFEVYALTNPEYYDWQPGELWEEAPKPEDGILVGSVSVERSSRRERLEITSSELLAFLKNHDHSEATFMFVRKTRALHGFGPGLTHTFGTNMHPETSGPRLNLFEKE